MLAEYTRRFYNPAAKRYDYLANEAMARARAIAHWKAEMREAWSHFAVKDVVMNMENGESAEQLNPRQPQLKVGSELSVRALVKLGHIRPEDVCVELYHGPTDSWGNIQQGSPVQMAHEQAVGDDGEHWFSGRMECRETGQHGVAVRVLPSHPDQVNPYDLGLILWEKG
jgi:starch phosphorylase